MDKHRYSGLLTAAQQSAIEFLANSNQIEVFIKDLLKLNKHLQPKMLYLEQRTSVLVALTKTFIKMGWKVGIEEEHMQDIKWGTSIYIDTPDGRLVFLVSDEELYHFKHLPD